MQGIFLIILLTLVSGQRCLAEDYDEENAVYPLISAGIDDIPIAAVEEERDFEDLVDLQLLPSDNVLPDTINQKSYIDWLPVPGSLANRQLLDKLVKLHHLDLPPPNIA